MTVCPCKVTLCVLAHLGNHLESQICQCSDEAPHVVESTCHLGYFKDATAIIMQNRQIYSVCENYTCIILNQHYNSISYPIFNTRLASAKKSARLVPMRERQNTTMSTEVSGRGTCTERGCFISEQSQRI